MALPISEMTAHTMRNRTKKLADNVSKNNALLNRLMEKGKRVPVSGGEFIMQELEYAENGTAEFYNGGYQTANITPQDVAGSASFDFKFARCAVTFSGADKVKNAGKEQVINLLETRIKNAEKSMMNLISGGIYSDGTGFGGLYIGGLQLLVSKTPAVGTVGNIPAATFSFWRNQAISNATLNASNIRQFMNTTYVRTKRGNMDKVDLIVADDNLYTAYLDSLQEIQRITVDTSAQAGFQSLKYMGADVVLDGGQGGFCPTNTMYFLNTNYIHWRPSSIRDFVVEDEIQSINQDAFVKFYYWAGNMTVSNRALQGVLFVP